MRLHAWHWPHATVRFRFLFAHQLFCDAAFNRAALGSAKWPYTLIGTGRTDGAELNVTPGDHLPHEKTGPNF